MLTFGEILFDHLPAGKEPGGGPLIAAAHAAALGSRVQLVSAVGSDGAGDELIAIASAQGIDTSLIQRNPLPTGRVKVRLNAVGDATYDIVKPVAWDALDINRGQLAEALQTTNCLAIWLLGIRSDTSFATAKWAVSKLEPTTLVAVDLGLRPPYFDRPRIEFLLQHAHVVKLNQEELYKICELLQLAAAPQVLAKAYTIDTLIVTEGKHGASSYRDGKVLMQPAPEVTVVDTVGCGDAFYAAYLHHRLRGAPEQTCLSEACARGALAATLQGGLPEAIL